MSGNRFDVCVIGGGLAGLMAAHEATTYGLSVGLVETLMPGGLIANVGAVAGYPGGEPSGAEIAATLLERAQAGGVVWVMGEVDALDASGAVKSISVAGGGTLSADQVVIASGATLRRLNVPGEREYEGRGVSQCAFCDAGLYKDRAAIVVGGGDGALQEALHLTEYCDNVTLVHRRMRLRARRHYVEQAANNPNIAFKWNAEVQAIVGNDNGVTGAVIKAKNKEPETVAADGVFVFVGCEPATAFLDDPFRHDESGALVVDPSLRTSVPGVYAAGAVRADFAGQVTNAMSDGALAVRTLVADGSG
ncbi:MAG: FAD-dependent oxidoreductase, partial [Pseudomonadota bacterium]